jgi:hypothetical protein
MVRERRTQISTMNKNTRFIPRFCHTTKVPYFLVEAPTKSRVLSTLILPLPTTKVKLTH